MAPGGAAYYGGGGGYHTPPPVSPYSSITPVSTTTFFVNDFVYTVGKNLINYTNGDLSLGPANEVAGVFVFGKDPGTGLISIGLNGMYLGQNTYDLSDLHVNLPGNVKNYIHVHSDDTPPSTMDKNEVARAVQQQGLHDVWDLIVTPTHGAWLIADAEGLTDFGIDPNSLTVADTWGSGSPYVYVVQLPGNFGHDLGFHF